MGRDVRQYSRLRGKDSVRVAYWRCYRPETPRPCACLGCEMRRVLGGSGEAERHGSIASLPEPQTCKKSARHWREWVLPGRARAEESVRHALRHNTEKMLREVEGSHGATKAVRAAIEHPEVAAQRLRGLVERYEWWFASPIQVHGLVKTEAGLEGAVVVQWCRLAGYPMLGKPLLSVVRIRRAAVRWVLPALLHWRAKFGAGAREYWERRAAREARARTLLIAAEEEKIRREQAGNKPLP